MNRNYLVFFISTACQRQVESKRKERERGCDLFSIEKYLDFWIIVEKSRSRARVEIQVSTCITLSLLLISWESKRKRCCQFVPVDLALAHGADQYLSNRQPCQVFIYRHSARSLEAKLCVCIYTKYIIPEAIFVSLFRPFNSQTCWHLTRIVLFFPCGEKKTSFFHHFVIISILEL